jgi:hypothetical protein
MDKVLFQQFQQKWQSMVEVEQRNFLDESVEMRFKKLNSMYLMAKKMGVKPEDDNQSEVIQARWKKIIEKSEL